MLLKSLLLNSAAPLWALAAMAPPDKPAAGSAGQGDADNKDGADDQGDAGDQTGADDTTGADDQGDTGDKDGADDQGDGEAGDKDGAQAKSYTEKDIAWRDKQMGKQHRKLKEKEAEAARLAQELADARALLERGGKKADGAAADAGGDTGSAQPNADDVRREAQKMVAQQDYDKACNTTFEAGKASYKDKWDGALEQLGKLGGLGEGQAGVEVMQSILATDDPAKVLFELGSNPETYERIMELPPAKRTAELVKLGVNLKPVKKESKRPSDAPAPTDGVERRANANTAATKLYDDNTPDEEWYQIRRAQKERRFKEKLQRGAA